MNEPRPDESVCRCSDVESMMAAYVDGERASCDCERVRAHVEKCACCRDRVAAERAAREVVRAKRPDLRATAPEALKARCALLANSPGASAFRPNPQEHGGSASTHHVASAFRRKNLLLRWAPFSLAATVLLAVAVVFGFGLTEKAQALAFQTTLDHMKCSRFNADHTRADADHAEHQWQSQLGWKIDVPDSSSSSKLELRGIKRCGVLDGSVAHVMYSWMGEPLSVYVLPKRTLSETATYVERFNHNSVMWSQNDRTYIIVTSHRRDPALDEVIAYVRSTVY